MAKELLSPKISIRLLALSICGIVLLGACLRNDSGSSGKTQVRTAAALVLGTVQDGGSPHIGCQKACCAPFYLHPDYSRKVISLGIRDQNGHVALIEASPDISTQLYDLNRYSGRDSLTYPDVVLLTHAHVGHYSGLMYFGRESAGAKNVRVMALPRMKRFLENNGPWSQLCSIKNIVIDSMQFDKKYLLLKNIWVTPIEVPHRDEYSETAAFLIEGPNRKLLFIPDIDKWEKWERNIVEEIKKVDYAFIDGTFYDAAEVANRNIAEIPHPFVIESIALFKDLSAAEKRKVYFIHLNHSNPLLNKASSAYYNITADGYRVATFGQTLSL